VGHQEEPGQSDRQNQLLDVGSGIQASNGNGLDQVLASKLLYQTSESCRAPVILPSL